MRTAEALERARSLARRGEDEGARLAYVDVLRGDPTHFDALNELGTLALAGGYRSAARTAYTQAVQHHPENPVGHVNLANVMRDAIGRFTISAPTWRARRDFARKSDGS